MKGFLSDDLLKNLKNITEANIALVNKKCLHLGQNQIQWKPSNDSWNIQEVLSHLNSYSSYYHHLFIEKVQNTKYHNPKENFVPSPLGSSAWKSMKRSEEHTSELQSRPHLVCRLLLEKKKKKKKTNIQN